jgi:hypothetical protein
MEISIEPRQVTIFPLCPRNIIFLWVKSYAAVTRAKKILAKFFQIIVKALVPAGGIEPTA